MAVTGTSLQARFPAALGALPIGVLDAAVAEAISLNNATTLGTDFDIAVQYHAAHLALIDRKGAADGIASATAGPVTTSFRGDNIQASFWDQYRSVLNRNVLSGMMISTLGGR